MAGQGTVCRRSLRCVLTHLYFGQVYSFFQYQLKDEANREKAKGAKPKKKKKKAKK